MRTRRVERMSFTMEVDTFETLEEFAINCGFKLFGLPNLSLALSSNIAIAHDSSEYRNSEWFDELIRGVVEAYVSGIAWHKKYKNNPDFINEKTI